MIRYDSPKKLPKTFRLHLATGKDFVVHRAKSAQSLATCYTCIEYILSVIHRGLSFSRLLGLLLNVVKNVNRHISIKNWFFLWSAWYRDYRRSQRNERLRWECTMKSIFSSLTLPLTIHMKNFEFWAIRHNFLCKLFSMHFYLNHIHRNVST